MLAGYAGVVSLQKSYLKVFYENADSRTLEKLCFSIIIFQGPVLYKMSAVNVATSY
jgi:hypothetical protein